MTEEEKDEVDAVAEKEALRLEESLAKRAPHRRKSVMHRLKLRFLAEYPKLAVLLLVVELGAVALCVSPVYQMVMEPQLLVSWEDAAVATREGWQRELQCCGFASPTDLPAGECMVALPVNGTAAAAANGTAGGLTQEEALARPGCLGRMVDEGTQRVLEVLVSAGVLQLLALLVAMQVYRGRRRRQQAHVQEVNDAIQTTEMGLAGRGSMLKIKEQQDKEEVAAALKLQAVYRGRRARFLATRMREYDAWVAMRRTRAVLVMTCYTIVLAYIAFATYIDLLYVVKFDEDQTTAWISSSLISVGIDVFIREPAMIMVKSFVIGGVLGGSTEQILQAFFA